MAMLVFFAASMAQARGITQIIDATGDGMGNPLESTQGIAVDEVGTVYVTGRFSHNAFAITDAGITEII
ncbi:MAG: hypothetical protein AAF657_30315, partial [Acidobacteriota bacterium]